MQAKNLKTKMEKISESSKKHIIKAIEKMNDSLVELNKNDIIKNKVILKSSMKLSDYVLDYLKNSGVKHAFLITGGALMNIVNSFDENKNLKYICTTQEQGAAIAAEAYSRITRNLGVAMATSGPGATNLITGIGCAYFDSIPVLYITGQVNTNESTWKDGPRQVGFQETDIVSIVKPITKFAVKIDNPEDIKYYLDKAIYIAKSDRPGPVLLDIPMNVQRAQIEPDRLRSYIPEAKEINYKLLDEKVEKTIELINKAKRPVIILGAGIKLGKAEKETRKFIERLGIPIALSWGAMDLLPYNHDLFIEGFGVSANRTGNFAVQNADLIISLGSRLDTRQTGGRPKTFARGAKKIVLDIDKNELYKGRGINIDVDINFNINDFLESINKKFQKINIQDLSEWKEKIKKWKEKYPICIPEYSNQQDKVNPYYFMNILSDESKEGDIIITDTGGNLTWTMQGWKVKEGQKLFSAFGNAPMGYSLPAAMGASIAASNKPIICIIGDGGIKMNINELETIVKHKLPIKIFVINNHEFGIIKQFQDVWLDSCYKATCVEGGLGDPDFLKIANAYEMASCKISNHTGLREKIREVLNFDGPILCSIELKSGEKIIPKLEFGKPIEDPAPLLDREEFKKNMIVPIWETYKEIENYPTMNKLDLKRLSGKTIVITGAAGMLGSAFKETLEKLKVNLLAFSHKEIDVTDENAVLSIAKHNPDIIIHCAGIVNADYCEKNQEEAYLSHVIGTKNIIKLAKINCSRVFYPQSFLIYGEEKPLVDEDTIPSPLSYYGKCKYEAERLLVENLDNALIVRMGGFFGGYEKDKNFVGKFIPSLADKIKTNEKVQEIGDRVWQPTYTKDLALNCLQLLSLEKSGIYNMASVGEATFFEVAEVILKVLKLEDKIELRKVSAKNVEQNQATKRPSKLIMENKRLKKEGLDMQRDWRESLKEYVDNPYFKKMFNLSILTESYESKIIGKLKNRIVMSAMSRSFSKNHLCNDLIKEYYLRRAKDGVGLILTEGIIINPSGDGYKDVPYLFNKEQMESWKKTTEDIKREGTKIFAQLWHCGRISHEDFTGGVQPVSSTDKPAEGICKQLNKPFAVPRKLKSEEIHKIIEMYLNSAKLAIEAGFDGVELHMGHGYLIDQFLDSRINDRTDEYGGFIENRCRFAIELTKAVIEEIGQSKVIVRISPSRDMNKLYNWPDLDDMISFLVPELAKAGLRMLDVSCARANYYQTSGPVIEKIRKIWPHILMGGASLSISDAEAEIKRGNLDLITYGRYLISNPDLVTKIKEGKTLVEYNTEMLKSLY